MTPRLKLMMALVVVCIALGIRPVRADSCTFDVTITTVCVTYNGQTDCENHTYITENCTYPLTWCDQCLNAEQLCRDDCSYGFNNGEISSLELMRCNSGCRQARNNCFRNCGT